MKSQNTCIECHKKPIYIKKHKLCHTCYQMIYRKQFQKGDDGSLGRITIKKRKHRGEIEFIKNYFKHKNWIYEPAVFHLRRDGQRGNYTPDFYDNERQIFIEVSATRQAYQQNKSKYQLFRDTFLGLTLEIRKPSGDLLDEDNPAWTQDLMGMEPIV